MPDIARLLTLDRTLQASITRLEGGPLLLSDEQKKHVPPGLKTSTVSGKYVSDIAFPRWFLWRLWLARRIPTVESARKVSHLLRGRALWHLAVWCEQHGRPLPVKEGVSVPAWALRTPPQAAERVQQPEQIRAEGDDPVTWWDANGTDAAGNTDALGQISDAELERWIADYVARLDYQDWLSTVLSDLQVLQILEGYYNGQAIAGGANDLLQDVGIDRTFDLTDPYMMNYIRFSSGIFVKGMEEKTRQIMGRFLWKNLGGEEGSPPLSVQALGRKLEEYLSNINFPVSRLRAQLIAVTETARAETFGQFITMLSTGVQQKVWVVTAGACIVCVTQAEQGPVPIRDPFPGGWMAPPGHPRCFPANTRVSGDAVAVTMRWYAGPMVRIYAEGYDLRATPNHPILTTRGWVAIGDVRLGDEIIVTSPEQQHKQRYANIENIANVLQSSQVYLRTVDGAPEDFHGDGDATLTIQFSGERSAPPEAPEPDLGELYDRYPTRKRVTLLERYPYQGNVYNLETADGWYLANDVCVHNCRCALSPWVDDTFNPKDWEFAPSESVLQNLFNDPSFALWPNEIVDFDQPELQLRPPTPFPRDVGLLQFGDLPAALQAVISEDAMMAGIAIDEFSARMADVARRGAQRIREEAAKSAHEPPPPLDPNAENFGVFNVDDILGEPESEELRQQVRSQLGANLDQLLSDLGLSGADIEDTGEE